MSGVCRELGTAMSQCLQEAGWVTALLLLCWGRMVKIPELRTLLAVCIGKQQQCYMIWWQNLSILTAYLYFGAAIRPDLRQGNPCEALKRSHYRKPICSLAVLQRHYIAGYKEKSFRQSTEHDLVFSELKKSLLCLLLPWLIFPLMWDSGAYISLF